MALAVKNGVRSGNDSLSEREEEEGEKRGGEVFPSD